MKNHQSLLMKNEYESYFTKNMKAMIVNKLLLVQRIEPKIETKEEIKSLIRNKLN